MTQIIFLPHEEICPDGAVIEVEPGTTICDAALANDIHIEHPSPVLEAVPSGSDFYFVHSYAFVTGDPLHTVATVDYGVNVAAVVGQGNAWGAQFHPEKSSLAGKRVLQNFLALRAC